MEEAFIHTRSEETVTFPLLAFASLRLMTATTVTLSRVDSGEEVEIRNTTKYDYIVIVIL